MIVHDSNVSLVHLNSVQYPTRAPFHPSAPYPEAPIAQLGSEPNPVYESFRELLRLSGYDTVHYGTPEWNPLGWLIHPGDTVFIKPNMISHKHALNDDWDYVITHGSIIRSMVDYVAIALAGDGRIIIGDAPQSDSRFDRIVAAMGLSEIRELYWEHRKCEIELVDLRDEYWIGRDGIYVETVQLPGDPRGSLAVDLSSQSLFTELDGLGKTYYGAFYDIEETNRHHRDGKHEYAISRTPVLADVFINIPKLKTHKKCGITVNLKSLVGINANKNWLPHYSFGSPGDGGDQFSAANTASRLENSIVIRAKRRLLTRNPAFQHLARRTKRLGYRVFGGTEDVVRSGNWHGNDTVWRMCLDLNRILLYGNPDGTMRTSDPKRYFSLVDGVVAMEGNGPVAGTPRQTGLLIGGCNPVAVDAVCAAVMGFDYHKLPLVQRAFDRHAYPLAAFNCGDIKVSSPSPQWARPLEEWTAQESFAFRPHFGWLGQIEAGLP